MAHLGVDSICPTQSPFLSLIYFRASTAMRENMLHGNEMSTFIVNIYYGGVVKYKSLQRQFSGPIIPVGHDMRLTVEAMVLVSEMPLGRFVANTLHPLYFLVYYSASLIRD